MPGFGTQFAYTGKESEVGKPVIRTFYLCKYLSLSNQVYLMKKQICSLVTLALVTSLSYGQGKSPKKPSKMWYRATPVELNDVKVDAQNIVSDKEITKFKLTVTNNTDYFIIVKPQECSFKSIHGESKPNDTKRIIVRPLDSENKVIDVTNVNSPTMHEYNFSFNVAGLYKSGNGTKAELPDYLVPATQNVIEYEDFRIELISASLQSNTQWRCKFKVTYTGKGLGVVEPRKISARTQGGGMLSNNGGEKAFALERGDSENFLVYISSNMPIVIVWNDAFKTCDLVKSEPMVMQMNYDPSAK